MKKSTIVITILVVVLIITNVFWMYKLLDFGVTYTYQGVSLEENQQALSQSIAVLNEVVKESANKTSIIEVAQQAWSVSEPFEKEGYLWVGRLGLKFGEQGQLIEVISQ